MWDCAVNQHVQVTAELRGGYLCMGRLGFTGLARKLEQFRNEGKLSPCDDNNKLQRLVGLTWYDGSRRQWMGHEFQWLRLRRSLTIFIIIDVSCSTD